MSETVHYTGKLIPTGKTVDQYMENIELSKYCTTKREHFEDILSDDAIEIDGFVFDITKESIDPYSDIMIATKNEDGSYNFEVKYYNGGCGFSEAIEYSLKAIDNALELTGENNE